jgi:hypothetical protein
VTDREIRRKKAAEARRRTQRLMLAAGVLVVILVIGLVIVFSGGKQPDPSLSTKPTQTVPPTTVPPTTVTPTEPPLTYPEGATPQQMWLAFMEYYDLSASDYPQVVQEAFLTSRENTEYLLNFPFLRDQKHEVDISDYDISEGVPLFIQWDERWGYLPYAGNYAGLAACGPTCLSMVAYYLTGDAKYDPVYMMEYAEANGYCGNRQGTYWSFFTEGAAKLGFIVKEEYLGERKLINLLGEGKLIILSVGPGHFTSAGHFIVVTGYEDGYFTVNDPNSYQNSQRKWAYDEFADQVKNLWSFGL